MSKWKQKLLLSLVTLCRVTQKNHKTHKKKHNIVINLETFLQHSLN